MPGIALGVAGAECAGGVRGLEPDLDLGDAVGTLLGTDLDPVLGSTLGLEDAQRGGSAFEGLVRHSEPPWKDDAMSKTAAAATEDSRITRPNGNGLVESLDSVAWGVSAAASDALMAPWSPPRAIA